VLSFKVNVIAKQTMLNFQICYFSLSVQQRQNGDRLVFLLFNFLSFQFIEKWILNEWDLYEILSLSVQQKMDVNN